MSASCEQESCEQGITLSGDLHARPAGALAVAAGRFASAVSVTAGGQTADAKSVLGVMGLGATSGQHVTVSAAGPDAQEAVAALIAILGEATKVGGLLPPRRYRRPGLREVVAQPAAHPADRGNLASHRHPGSLGRIISIPNGPCCVPRRPVSPSLS
jgi:phosphocarrier protein HPr